MADKARPFYDPLPDSNGRQFSSAFLQKYKRACRAVVANTFLQNGAPQHTSKAIIDELEQLEAPQSLIFVKDVLDTSKALAQRMKMPSEDFCVFHIKDITSQTEKILLNKPRRDLYDLVVNHLIREVVQALGPIHETILLQFLQAVPINIESGTSNAAQATTAAVTKNYCPMCGNIFTRWNDLHHHLKHNHLLTLGMTTTLNKLFKEGKHGPWTADQARQKGKTKEQLEEVGRLHQVPKELKDEYERLFKLDRAAATRNENDQSRAERYAEETRAWEKHYSSEEKRPKSTLEMFEQETGATLAESRTYLELFEWDVAAAYEAWYNTN